MKIQATLLTLRMILIAVLLLLVTIVSAQDYGDDTWTEVTPHAIPSAPAFSLLGVNPETVTRPTDVKSFKVDWRIKNYKVAPDLAFEAQPIWWLHTRRKGPKAYREASNLSRVLSTTTFSLATAKIDNVNHLSYAIKLNVYKEHDPFLHEGRSYDIEDEISEMSGPLQQQIDSLQVLYSKSTSPETKKLLEAELGSLKAEKDMYTKMKMDEVADEAYDFSAEHWNMDMVDVAFGRVFKYNNGALDSLKFDSAGFGLWINAAKGIGENGLLTGLIRYNRVGINSDLMLGASFRYGSRKFNFFSELVYASIGNNPLNGYSDDEEFADLYAEDLGNGWYEYGEGDGFSKWSLSYGGDFRLSKNVLLNFAIRTELTGGFSFDRLLPVANLVCLMN